MVYFLHDKPLRFSRKGCNVFLAFCWFAGLICGILIYLSADETIAPLMLSAVSGSVSIVILLCVTAFPFLFSAIAVFLSLPWLLFLLSFAKAVCFSFVSIAVCEAWHCAGWLIRYLLLFSDCLTVPILYFLWLRYVSGKRRCSCAEMFAFFSAAVLIGSIDYCIITPFLARMIVF